MVIFNTERLIVRRWTENDAADLFEYCSDPIVTKYLTFPIYASIDDARARIADTANLYATFRNGEEDIKQDFAVEVRGEGKVIGSVGISWSDFKNKVVDVGYTLNSKYWHKGFMTEVLVGMIKYIKENKIAKRIEAKYDPENVASGAVMKRAGMKYVGVRKNGIVNNANGVTDVVVYAVDV